MHKKLLFLLFIAVALSSCETEREPDIVTVAGMTPIYIEAEDNFVAVTEPRPFGDLGKIVYAAPYLMINERYKGIHIVDNSNPEEPLKLNFIQIPGNTEFTFRQGYLYANHGSDFKVFQFGLDMVSTQLTEDFGLEETCVISEFFAEGQSNTTSGLFPPNYTGFFECVDPDKGILINWEETTLIDPECRI